MPKTITRDGLVLEYDDAGTAETALLCMPGWCIERTLFAPLLARAGKRLRVLALDWRGHGGSSRPAEDFGAAELVEDAVAIAEASGAPRIIPLAQAHAGWLAIDVAQRLGARAAKIACTSWMMFAPPPPFATALAGLQNADRWQETRDALVAMWLHDGPPPVTESIKAMTERYDGAMWARGAREIAAAFARHGSAAEALARLSRPALHLYAQPRAPEVLAAHEALAQRSKWFGFARLEGSTHFPTLETPDAVFAALEAFAA
jgi:pimeloyl-ACP methyl ester carboxylesterase